MRRRAISILVLMALLIASCTSGDPDINAEDFERETPRGSILPPSNGDAGEGGEEQEPEIPENTDDGRLVVESATNQLSTMLPDGSEPMELTDPGTINSQASWAPDGSRIAWVAVDETTGQAHIASDRFDRSDYRDVSVDTEPTYLYWDPSSARIAHLAPSTGGLDLGVAELLGEDGPTNRRIDRGEPYYLAWGPDGDELLVHASGFRLDRIDLGDATIIIEEFPANFGAATWLQDDSLVFADIEEDEQFLITTGDAGEGRRPLITYEGRLRFAVSNEGNRIAMQAVPADDEEGVVTASYGLVPDEDSIELVFQPAPTPTPTPEFDDSLDAIDPIVQGIPYIMGTFGGEPFALSSQPAVAMFPSPDGQATIWYEQMPFEDDGVMNISIDFAGEQHQLRPFIPSDEMLTSYFPFFDQYSNSHDFWSPSSNLYVYAGRPAGSDEPDGIWVYDRSTRTETRISDGVVATFTRTPQAGGAASSL